jgi:hypothetical protein
MGGPLPADRRRQDSPQAWVPADLKRATGLLAAVAAFSVSVPISFNASCQVHEIGHALVGTALGWTVDRVHLCLPAGGSVEYASTPGAAWVNTAESFAGGVVAAGFLALVYLLVFHRRRMPLRGPGWWAAGFGPALWIGPQLLVGVVEGTNPDRDYTQVLDTKLPLTLTVIAMAMLVGATGHVWLWRSLWNRARL